MKIVLLNHDYQADAAQLSDETGFAVQDHRDLSDFCLIFSDKVQLFAPKKLNLSPLSVDFNDAKIMHRFKFDASFAKNLAKAIGVKSNYKPFVVDATAGLAQDSLAIMNFGCQVLMIERNPIIATLLKSALKIGSKNIELNKIISSNLSLEKGDAMDILPNIKTPIQVVYLDPMFPNNHKRRLPSRTMQYFRTIIGSDTDYQKLFYQSEQILPKRIVVKRSVKDGFISDQKPHHQIIGKTTRYDVYMPI